MLQFISYGILEYRILEYWNIGILVYWKLLNDREKKV